MFYRFHMKVGQFLLHITTQTASVQVRRFSAAIYQWRPSSNTSRRRFPLLSALFFEKNTVFGMIPRTTVLLEGQEARMAESIFLTIVPVFWTSTVFSTF